MKRLSVVLATRNEEKNIAGCLNSIKEIADEIVVVDENSEDRTREIARELGAKVYKVAHEPIFHKTKQKALDKASGDWILQLDADERVTSKLALEIKKVIEISAEELHDYCWQVLVANPLFKRHEQLIEKRDGRIGKETGQIVAFFIPRLNMFLGKPLRHAGVYPDPAIRLIKKGMARFPSESVHEIMRVEGEVGWLRNPMEHHDSPTLKRYFDRLNRYTDLKSQELQNSKTPRNPIYFVYYAFIKPITVFINLYILHKGFLDGMRGFLWSFFSASHFPIAYFKYFHGQENNF